MENKYKLYERYTSTSSLTSGVDEKQILAWSKGYFRVHYSRLLPNDKCTKILEIGCGYGKYIQALSEMGYEDCYGIDLSPEQIAYAKSVLGLSNVEQADALDWLNGKECIFDCILGLDILEHFQTDDLLALCEKIYASLKPGGIAIFQIPNGMSPFNPIVYGDLTHMRAFTPKSMQQLFLHVALEPAGFFEIPPYVHGIKSAVQRAIWDAVAKPAISALVRMLHGKVMGGNIYTSNFIACAIKKTFADDDVVKVA